LFAKISYKLGFETLEKAYITSTYLMYYGEYILLTPLPTK